MFVQPPCRLGLIGGFDLQIDDRPSSIGDGGARLLTLLALSGRHRAVSRQSAAERLWCDDGTRAPARLRNTLWRLPRTELGPLVVGSGASLQLADHVEVDVWAAEDTAHALDGDGDQAERFDLRPFAQDLLPEWPEDWLVLERESFRQTRLHALERASSRLCAQGSHAAALQAALTAVACEPLRETAQCRVVEAHLAEGNHAEALRQYQSYRRLLAAELGLAPTPAMRRLVGPLLGRPVDHFAPAPVRSAQSRPDPRHDG
ncbi:BTAD domain-containing putative transcriptional regulator [uncultured Jatrophihabitans sp.]|uniref:AfsR/SARP family transcriptional regulator n=1 Tax=uncultured Jatrophihabitans sp. TaxID=1610747 RepID=UPI0035C9D898